MQNKSLKKQKSKGGKRVGSGRKKADYETKTIAFRVRVATTVAKSGRISEKQAAIIAKAYDAIAS